MPGAALYITGLGALSPASGAEGCRIAPDVAGGLRMLCAKLSPAAEALLSDLPEAQRDLDRSALMSIAATRAAAASAGLAARGAGRLCVSVGSARGATGLLERLHGDFLAGGGRRTRPLTSPLTTSGNLASNAAHALEAECGGEIDGVFSHSSTCGSALQALASAAAWLRAGMADTALCGGAEAPLTPFTLAQMRALRIYSQDYSRAFPCRPLGAGEPASGMVLGEGACMICIERAPGRESLAELGGIGAGFERAPSAAGVCGDGEALFRAMRGALQDGSLDRPDAVVLHAPGTPAGDSAEIAALGRLFGAKLPFLVSNKWRIGHTLGAAGAFNIESAITILRSGRAAQFPYQIRVENPEPAGPIRSVLVNACGFGGNALSVLLRAARN